MKENNNIATAYALENEELIHIRDVDRNNKGKYYCPSCKEEMVANKGPKNAMNFAHKDTDCGHAKESIIHLLAKEVLLFKKKLFLPELIADIEKIGLTTLIPSCEYFADHVHKEKYFGDFRPDVFMENNDQSIAVEILYKHAVEDDKIIKIQREKLSTVEVDLTSLIDKEFTIEDVEKLVISEIVNKEWLFHKEKEQLIENKITELTEIERTAELEQIEKEKNEELNRINAEREYQEYLKKYAKNKTPLTLWQKIKLGGIIGGITGGITYLNAKKSTRKKINKAIGRFFYKIFK